MKTVAISNQKGGTSKTVTALNLAAGLHNLDQKVLVVDLDPQANLTYALGLTISTDQKTILDLMNNDQVSWPDLIVQRERNGMSVIPAHLGLSAAEVATAGMFAREKLIADKIDGLAKDFDFVLFDCPPSLGILTVSALTAADAVFVPVQTEFLAYAGVAPLLQTIEQIKRRLNPRLKIAGLLPVRYHSQKIMNQQVVQELQQAFPKLVFRSIIRECIALAHANGQGETIFEYEPNSHGAEDYRQLTAEFLERLTNGHL